MKNNILIGCLGVMAFLFSSCEKEGITMYEESPTVYFEKLPGPILSLKIWTVLPSATIP